MPLYVAEPSTPASPPPVVPPHRIPCAVDARLSTRRTLNHFALRTRHSSGRTLKRCRSEARRPAGAPHLRRRLDTTHVSLRLMVAEQQVRAPSQIYERPCGHGIDGHRIRSGLRPHSRHAQGDLEYRWTDGNPCLQRRRAPNIHGGRSHGCPCGRNYSAGGPMASEALIHNGVTANREYLLSFFLSGCESP